MVALRRQCRALGDSGEPAGAGSRALADRHGPGQRVYLVDDLPVLPYTPKPAGTAKAVLRPAPANRLSDFVQRSRLCAVDAASGEIAWQVGGSAAFKGAAPSPVDDCLFLGPPLP